MKNTNLLHGNATNRANITLPPQPTSLQKFIDNILFN